VLEHERVAPGVHRFHTPVSQRVHLTPRGSAGRVRQWLEAIRGKSGRTEPGLEDIRGEGARGLRGETCPDNQEKSQASYLE
jgi:hypothetical protein